MKTCSRCRTAKSLEEFHRNAAARDGRRSDCKDCHLALVKERHRLNPEPGRARAREYRTANIERVRAKQRTAHFERTYGITDAERDASVEARSSRCDICDEQASLVVDHDHDSGAVRGYLCQRCNLALGGFRDDDGLLLNAVQYLRTHGVLTITDA